MGSFSFGHWLVVIAVAIIFLSRGRFSAMAADAAKGIQSFKKGLAQDEETNSAHDVARDRQTQP